MSRGNEGSIAMDVDSTSTAQPSTSLPTSNPPNNDCRPASTNPRKSKQQSKRRNQRLRQEKGIERAEAVADQLSQKVGKSKGRGKVVKERRRDWSDINAAPADGVERDAWMRKRERKLRKFAKREQVRAERMLAAATEGAQGGAEEEEQRAGQAQQQRHAALQSEAGGRSRASMDSVDASFVSAREDVDGDDDVL